MPFRVASVLTAFLLTAAVLTLPASAQEAPERSPAAPDTGDVAFRVMMPDSVVVTASRLAESSRTSGRRVSVYTRQDIADLAVNSIDQLLDVVAGVDVKSRGAFGVQSDLTLRGSTFNGVLVLLDGARINDPMTGHFLMDLPVPLSEIARVEVLRGPATALYGPDALGGVVHLITRTGLRTEGGRRTGWSTTAEGRYGKNNLYDASGSTRYVGDETTVSAAAAAQGSDGIPITGADGEVLRSRNGEVRTDFTRQAATVALSRETDALGGATLYSRAGFDNRDFGAWHYYSTSPADTAREATRTYWLQTRLQSDRSAKTTWTAQLAAKQHADTYRFYPGLTPNRNTSRLLTAQAQASRSFGAVRLTGGASGQLRGIDSNGLGLHSDPSGGVFASFRWQATDRLTINHSTRLDYDAVYGVEPTPQLFLAYRLGRTTLRLGGGRAVRAPNYIERYISYGGNQGTPDLDAETAWSGEAGVDVRLGEGLTAHLTGFGRVTRGLIDYAKETEGAEVFVVRNLHRVETLGLEAEAAFDRRLGPVGLRLDAAYTLLDATLDAQEPVFSYKYALTGARHHVQGGASASLGAWTLGMQGMWKERLATGGPATDRYGLLHARLGYTTRLFDTRVTLSADLRNLLDTTYTEVLDAPMPGRTLLVGGQVRF
jgi:iron complex outermembrane receptor protein